MNFILPSLLLPSSLQEAHVNSCYKHFYYFVTEFTLVNPKEFEPLVSVVFSLVAEIFKGKGRGGGIEGGGRRKDGGRGEDEGKEERGREGRKKPSMASLLVFEEQGENEGRGEESKNEGGEFGRVV